ncbi:MAG: hypothetical protein ACYDBB_25540 [Armatimonadota bacterium]
MGCIDDLFEEFRRLPTQEMVLHISGKSVFSFGLGAVLASSMKGNWRVVGYTMMVVGTVMGLPALARILKR